MLSIWSKILSYGNGSSGAYPKPLYNMFISEDCNGIKCQHGAECINGRCRCPKVCPSTDQPVCGSDMKTYQNECEMMKEACKKGIELHVVDSGECDPLYTGSGGNIGQVPSVRNWHNSLPNDKYLDWSKLKAFAADKINTTEKQMFFLG